MSGERGSARLDGVFALLMTCVFALCAVAVLLAGVRVYKSVGAGADECFDRRTTLAYVEAKARSFDSASEIETGAFGGASSLAFRESYDGTAYITYLYSYNGGLYELFTAEASGVGPDGGTLLLEDAGDVSFERAGKHSVRVSRGGKTITIAFRAATVVGEVDAA